MGTPSRPRYLLYGYMEPYRVRGVEHNLAVDDFIL